MPAGIVLNLFARQYASKKDFKVEREGNGITITKYIGTKKEVSIPPLIQNLPVTSIGNYAFSGNASLTAITIPASVTEVGWGAFAFCYALTPAIRTAIEKRFGKGVLEYE
jgi:hypothetical protein